MGLVEPTLREPSTLLPPGDLTGLSDEELLKRESYLGLADPYYFETEILGIGKEEDLPRAEDEIRPILLWFDQPRPLGFPPKRRFLIYYSSSRFTAKTFCCAAMITKRIIQDPNTAWLIQCELKTMAEATVRMIRDWLLLPKVERLYGKFLPANAGSEQFIVLQRTKHRRDPTVQASGLDVGIQSWHPDGVWWDDLIGDNNAHLAGFKKAKERVGASMPVLRQDGMGIYTCTRYGPEDPAGWILDNSTSDQKTLISGEKMWYVPPGRGFFGAYAVEGDEKFFEHAEVGKTLFDTILPEEEIEFYRKHWTPERFYSQILNDPIPPEGRYFEQKDFQYFKRLDERGEPLETLREGLNYMALDVAGGKEQLERGDESAMGVGNVRWLKKTPEMRMLEAVGGRWKTDRVVDTFLMLVDEFRPVKIFVEKNKGEEWLIDCLVKPAQQRGIYLPIEKVHWGRGDDKKDRIQALVTPYRYHQIFHEEHLKAGKIERGLLNWRPGGKVLDDFADMEAMLWIKATKSRRKRGEDIKVGHFNRRRWAIYKRTGV